MSQFINVQMLAALGLGKSRKPASGRFRTPTPALTPPPRMDDVAAVTSDEPASSSRIRIARGYALS